MSKDQKICFVVMGFGKKTDFETGRLLDLDATYEAIIQPAVVENNLRCIRANEIVHSGVIDVKMYEMLLRADLVIADISTGNANAIYELGVRHALRPYSTIIMKEDKGRLYFDLDHVNTFQYSHLGEDIGHKEAKRASADLGKIISEVMVNQTPDSPVYTFIPALKKPLLPDAEFKELLEDAEEVETLLSTHLANADDAVKISDHAIASKEFEAALAMNPGNPYLVQQYALHRYKTKHPSEFAALKNASTIIDQLDPENSNDPETLGISGAIHKRLWGHSGDRATLDKAISFYKRGFDLRKDYYNGENAAICLEIRSVKQEDVDEAKFDRMFAGKIRTSVIESLEAAIADGGFDQRSDSLWVFATIANCHFALNEDQKAEEFERQFLDLSGAEWERQTYFEGKASVLAFRTET